MIFINKSDVTLNTWKRKPTFLFQTKQNPTVPDQPELD